MISINVWVLPVPDCTLIKEAKCGNGGRTWRTVDTCDFRGLESESDGRFLALVEKFVKKRNVS
jgi:hypothetical protein